MAKKSRELPEISMDMTPMIDVVFNLLIFFMLVNQMAQVERAVLALPKADQAKEEQQIGEISQLIINVHKTGDLEIAGNKVTQNEFTKILEEETREKDKEGNSQRAILIRGDCEAEFRVIKEVMFECAKNKIFKVSFSAELDK